MRNRDPLHIRWAYSLVGVTQFPISGAKHPLEKEAMRYVLWSAGVALLIGISAFLYWQWLINRVPEVTGDRQVNIVRYTELGVPPSIDRAGAAGQQVAMASTQTIAVPEAVPDELASEQTIMTQQEIDQVLSAITATDLGDMDGTMVVGGVTRTETTTETQVAAPVNVLPVKLSMKQPEYPEMARLAGIEGTVVVNVLVSKDGRVVETKVVEGPSQLHKAAIAAAMTAMFRPASQNNRPVAVWVAIPLRFKLH